MTMTAFMGSAQNAPSGGLHKVLKTAKAAGEGGYDYIFADSEARRLYVPRGGPAGRLTVFDLDTLEPAGTIPAGADIRNRAGRVPSNQVANPQWPRLAADGL